MNGKPSNRRDFLRTAAGATLLFWGSPSRGDDTRPPPIQIRDPFHGAVLNHRHGKQTDRGMEIVVKGDVAAPGQVTVNGAPARRIGGQFEADVVLSEKEADLTAVCQGDAGRHEDRVRVVFDRASRPRYRFSIDDNSFFLRDVFQKQYKSLFDCFYLKMLRDLHAAYGVKYTVNIYFWPFYQNYLPDHPKRLDLALRWVTEHGFQPVFFHEGFLGGAEG